MDTGKYGTVQLEAFMGSVATVANTTAVALEDGRISFTEGIEIAMKSIPLATSITSIGSTYKELKDLHESEVERVTNAFSDRFDLTNDKAEAFIELVVGALLANTALVIQGKSIFVNG